MANFIIWRLTKGVRVTGQTVVYQHGSSRISGGSTGSHVTGSGHDRKWRQSHDRKWSRAHAQSVPALFSYYSSSTKCIIAHDRHDYRMWRHVTPKGIPLEGCAQGTFDPLSHPKEGFGYRAKMIFFLFVKVILFNCKIL
jgi:hypothetical protein